MAVCIQRFIKGLNQRLLRGGAVNVFKHQLEHPTTMRWKCQWGVFTSAVQLLKWYFTIWPSTTSSATTYLGLTPTFQRCRLGDVNEGVSPVLCNFWSDIFIILSSVTSSATYPRLTPNIQRCIPGNANEGFPPIVHTVLQWWWCQPCFWFED